MHISYLKTNLDDNPLHLKREDLYGINRWGRDYFGVSDKGEVTVRAPTENGVFEISLKEIVDGLEKRDLQMPVMLRLNNLIHSRIKELNEGFKKAIANSAYQGKYQGVFPVKVNQQRHIIEEIAHYGEHYNFGFEVGSKAELLIVMSTMTNRNSLIICNGFKDKEFVDLALQSRKLGFMCFFVVENTFEIPLILERSKYWAVDPLIGLRLKLSTKVDGHWSNDSGDQSLFGLNSMQLLQVIDEIKQAGMIDCLQLIHFHLGSQIPSIRNIRDGVREACRYYVTILKQGAPLKYLDLGGGLAVDYDGTASTGEYSRNYTQKEYCVGIVETIQESLSPYEVEHPNIITESGRATVAPMSVLLFNILGVNGFDNHAIEDLNDNDPEVLVSLWETLEAVSFKRLQECYNDAFYYRHQLQEIFRLGQIDLRDLAKGEKFYLTILHRIAELVPQIPHPSPELKALKETLVDIYYGNLSIFQSLPDSWAIGQVFPIMPIHRLNEKATRHAIIGDLTCDCDGKIDTFVGEKGLTKTIPLCPLVEGEEYYLGVFLVGAYQETLGDVHNLFGATNVASVYINKKGNIQFVNELQGDSIADVISYVEYRPQEVYEQFHSMAETAVNEKRISIEERQTMLGLFKESLNGYTYFEQ